jgi:ADP-dependent phosphofructokinase/glucokinase
MNPPLRDWPALYARLARQLPALAAKMRPALCGFSACVDKYLDLHAILPLLLEAQDEGAVRLGYELKRRAAAGIGGEVRADWPDGPAWLDRLGPFPLGMGGTGVQAATALALLGAPAVLALDDRSAAQLSVIHPDVLVADAGEPRRLGTILPSGKAKPSHYIFEYANGRALAGIVPPRSTRVIVRFADDGFEHDAEFSALTRRIAAEAGTGLLSGFNGLAPSMVEAAIAPIAALAEAWGRAGLAIVHVEFGDFPQPAVRAKALRALAGHFNSLGMNAHELELLAPDEAPFDVKAFRLAERLGLDRICIHADEWAFSITRHDPVREREALLAGCLLAAARAEAGRLVVPAEPPRRALFARPPEPSDMANGWHFVSCPAPYLERPAATIGLGDTFVAGTLLVLGQPPAVPLPI